MRSAPIVARRRSEGFGGVVGRDWEFLLEEDVAGVESGVDAHGGDAGDGLAVGDGPLDGRGAAIFREQRGVQVDVAESAVDRASIAG